jgi:putative MATE family efflux protein
MGAGVVISRYFGSGQYDKVSKAIHTNVALGIVSGIILTILGVVFTPTILVWMGTDKEVLPQSIIYLRYYFSGALTIVMYNILKGIMNAVGDSKRPLYYLIFSSLLNVVLELLFVGVLGMGVGSSAVATVISQAVSVLLCFKHLLKKGTIYQISFKKLRFHGEMVKEIIKYGVPTGVQNSVIGFANVLVQSNINSFGADAMAACGSYSKIEGFAFVPITCFSMALTTFIGQNLGAGQYERAKEGARFGIACSLIMAEAIGVIVFLGAPYFIAMFNNDPKVVAIGVTQSRTVGLFYFLLSFSHCIAGICRGAGKAVVPMVIMLSIWCVLRIIYITIAMHYSHEIVLLFWAYPITWTISSIIYLIYYLKSDWIHGFDKKIKRGHLCQDAV